MTGSLRVLKSRLTTTVSGPYLRATPVTVEKELEKGTENGYFNACVAEGSLLVTCLNLSFSTVSEPEIAGDGGSCLEVIESHNACACTIC
jgi:hypothetical protein